MKFKSRGIMLIGLKGEPGGEVDKTLTKEGAAADAKAVGDKLAQMSGGGGGTAADSELSETSTNSVQNQAVTKALKDKVDKVAGMGLSTNDYTTDEQEKLAGVEAGANKTTVDSSMSSTSTNPVQNKVINAALNLRVAKVSGKGLSTNDYTNADRDKLTSMKTETWTFELEDGTTVTKNVVVM